MSERGATYYARAAAIHGGDGKAFTSAFHAIIAARDRVMMDIAETEGRLWIGGISMLRIAELHGLPTKREYKFIPG
jgi:hypothetical protein